MTQRNGWLAILAVAFAGEAAQAQCSEWTAEFALPGTGWGSYEEATFVYDDGTGPALYVGCGGKAAGLEVNGIARWNGTEWSALGTGLEGYLGLGGPRVHGFAAFDDGSGTALYAAGFFDSAGGVVAENLARWDGTSWSAVATGFTGLNSVVWDIAVWDDGGGPALYAAGSFTAADGVPAAYLARWDGTTWSEVGGGLEDVALDLEVFDGELHVAGAFTAAGGIPSPGFARWDGSTWTPLVGGLAVVSGSELGTWDDGSGAVLVATVRIGSSDSVAQWDGTVWTSMGGGFSAKDFDVYDDGSGPALYMAEDGGPYRWNGSGWVQVGGGVQPEGPWDLAVFDEGNGPKLFAFGPLDTAGPSATLAGGSARWEGGTSWSAVGPTGQGLKNTQTSTSGNAEAHELHVADLGAGSRLYVGGLFDRAGETVVSAVAAWDGTTWSPVGSISSGPNPGHVYALQAWDDGNGLALFAGGAFNWIGVSALNMARWNGVSWSNIGDFNGVVNDLALYDEGFGEKLYAVGAFTQPWQHIAKWTGSSWNNVAGGLDKLANAMAIFDDGSGPSLFVGGQFNTAGATPVSKIARYDGQAWFDVGGGVQGGAVFGLVAHDDGSGPALFAAGKFTAAGTSGASYVARWDGTGWSALAGGNPDGPVYALAVHDEGDGRGPGLYVGGEFTAVGGLATERLARWDPTGWSTFALGPDATVWSLTTFGDGSGWPSLIAAGEFDVPGKGSKIASWSSSCACQVTSYCTAGTSANGCQAVLGSTGTPSETASTGFVVEAGGVEGVKDGLFFYGTHGAAQGNTWGNGTSYMCVFPPTIRSPALNSGGTLGACDGSMSRDMNAYWTAFPQKNPGVGTAVHLQLWYRDPANTSNQTTSLSDGLTFVVCP